MPDEGRRGSHFNFMEVIIIDGSNALHRFGHVSQNLKVNGKGTGVAFHLIKFLLRAKRSYPRARFVICWDSSRQCQAWQQNWRVKLYPEYKANRDKKERTPAEVELQKFIMGQRSMIDDLALALGIPYIEVAGLEADDLIGILAKQCLLKQWKPIVYSGDKDFLQLLIKDIQVIRPVAGGKLVAASDNDVFESFGCAIDDVLKVRAIAGDTSDGIYPAVRGIGPKRAVQLVADGADPQLKTFDEHAKAVKAKIAVLQADWRRVHTNWRIMRILTSYSPKLLGELNSSVLRTNCAGVMSELVRPADCDYKGLCAFLGKWQLNEALLERAKLRRIQQ